MCGINGFFNYSNLSLFEEEALIAGMNRAISHRGPDDRGIWIDRNNGVSFGHQRLSILDLSSSGHQPMVSKNNTVIVYNGEIYNFKSLKKNLNEYSFFSETDTEVLLYLYERYGHKCLEHLNGMFAFAIWDKMKGELFLSRDRIGIKPLYYTTLKGVFAFSSEIKALLTLPWVKAELDEKALYDFLTFNSVSPPQTMFKDIHKFHPGYKMIVGENGIKIYKPYWEMSYSNYDSLRTEAIEELILAELERSVQNRMVSDVPVGAFLSGGVDSSSIVALMSKHASKPIKTYSIGFQDAPDYDELIHARKIAKQFGTEHYEKIVTPQDIIDFLPKVVEIYDEPLADSTSIPMYFISKLARENGSVVVLTGDGADELFCGYRNWMRYINLYPYYGFFYKFPKILKVLIMNIYGLLDKSSPTYDHLSRAVIGQKYLWSAGGFKETTKRSFLSLDFNNRSNKVNSYDRILHYRKLFESTAQNGRVISEVDWLCYSGFKDSIPNRYLYRADHLGMAHSIELRVPFLDHKFVNLALSIQGRWKINKGEPKYILKKSLERILDSETLYRKKKGFCVPLREWAGDIILDYIDTNLRAFCRDTGLFNEEGLREQVIQTKKGNNNYIFSLWNIYFLMSWFKKWIL